MYKNKQHERAMTAPIRRPGYPIYVKDKDEDIDLEIEKRAREAGL